MRFSQWLGAWDTGAWPKSYAGQLAVWPLRILYILIMLLLLTMVAQAQTTHHATLSWVLSTDDTSTACPTSAVCGQNVYRAQGSCTSTTISWTLLTNVQLGATVTTFTDSTLTPGQWCYGVTFSMNGLESVKDTVQVSLPPSPPSGLTGTAQ